MKRLSALLARLARLGAEVAANKATRQAAEKLANTVGPHRALGKIGLLSYLVGLLLIAGAWFFLQGGWFWFATVTGALALIVGFSLRSVNDLVVGFIVRAIEAVVTRVRKRIEARAQRKAAPPASSAGSTNGQDSKQTNSNRR